MHETHDITSDDAQTAPAGRPRPHEGGATAILARALTPASRHDDPFPHYVVRDALPLELYSALAARFPDDARIREGAPPGDNLRFSWSAGRTLDEPMLDPLWRRFIADQVSQEALDAVLAAFAPAIQVHYPFLEERMGPMERWRAGLRKRDSFDLADVLVDAQICLNSPVLSAPSSVRGPHVDKPNKLFAGLFYMRPEGDDTVGGDLLIQRSRVPQPRFEGSQLDPSSVETVGRVPYAANTLVMFLNGLDAMHAVTPRAPTPRSRYFVNLVGEVPHALFDLGTRKRPFRRG